MDCCGNLEVIARSAEFYLLFLAGLSISLGHCTGMCGPLITAFALSQREGNPGWGRMTLRMLTYHSGRIFTYTLIGCFMGLLGATLFLTGEGRVIQGALSFAIGFIMLALSLGLLGWLPTNRWLETSALQPIVLGKLRGLLSAPSPPKRFLLGFANGFLPCGPVFSAAMAAASTASLWRGGAAMLGFGLGTLPVLMILGVGVSRLSIRIRSLFNKLAAILLLLIAVQLILRGLASWGIIAHLRFGEFVIW